MIGAIQRWCRPAGFAVIDVETTGLHPAKGDRIVEIAVVHLDAKAEITGRWETIVNPERAMGASHIHGLTAADVAHAPRFAAIAPQLSALLSGRVVVAHNLKFDRGFLQAEWRRSQLRPPARFTGLCTMEMARPIITSGLSLANCCAEFGINQGPTHQASADALAAARLLQALLPHPHGHRVSRLLRQARPWPRFGDGGGTWMARPRTDRAPRNTADSTATLTASARPPTTDHTIPPVPSFQD